MNKSFYTFTNFFLALTTVSGLFTEIVNLLLGRDIFYLKSYISWYSLVNFVFLVSSLLVLKYYYRKNYRVAFWTGTVYAIVSFCFACLIFYQMFWIVKGLEKYNAAGLFLTVASSIPYAASLIFSYAGKRPWLKAAGILAAVAGVIMLIVIICFFNTKDAGLTADLEKTARLVSMAGAFMPFLILINFRNESMPTESDAADKASFSDAALGMLAIASFVCTVFLGIMLGTQAYGFNRVSWKEKTIAQPFEARSYAGKAGDTLQYRLLKPLDFDPENNYPLVVCLPYSCADDNIRQISTSPPALWLSEPENRKKYPAFLFVPRCPKGTGWGGVPGNPSVDSLALDAIEAVMKEPGIDKKRVYVSGVSRGGYGSWHFIGTRPDLFAAAVPVCGGDNPALGKNMVHVAVWAFHGAKDRNVPVGGSRDIIAAMKKSGGKPKYTEYPEGGHNIWEDVQKTPGLLDWLFAQKQD